MLSFFWKKKNSPDTPNEENIQGPSDTISNNSADDFIFIEKKSGVDTTPSSTAMYPQMPSSFGGLYPRPLYPPQELQSTTTNQAAVPYVQDVPFAVAPQLLIKSTTDLTQTQVDGILAMLTRQISVEEKEEYNFSLEKFILSCECS